MNTLQHSHIKGKSVSAVLVSAAYTQIRKKLGHFVKYNTVKNFNWQKHKENFSNVFTDQHNCIL